MTTAAVEIKSVAVEVKNLGGMIESWLRFLRVSPKTSQTYTIAIRQWKNYCDNHAITSPARADVANFLDGLISAKKSASTVNLYCTAVKLFYRWTALEGLYPNIGDNMKSGVKCSQGHKKDSLTAEQGGKLINAFKGDKLVDKRNKAIVALMITAGLRTIEIHRANVEDLAEINGRHYLYVKGKGRFECAEKILVAAQVYQLIEDYLTARNAAKDEPLFTSTRRNKGGRLSTQSISKMVKATLKSVGIDSKRITAHSLRHSAACQMILAGVELRQVQAVLRHKNINTTLIYLDEVDRLKNTAEQSAADAFFANC